MTATTATPHAIETTEVDEALRGLVARIADRVAGELTDRRSSEGAGWSVADQRSLARQLVIDALEGDAATRLRTGTPPLDDAAERAVVSAVLDRLFGLGRLQPLLDDPSVSDIEINGCDRVFVTYRDGTKTDAAPVADSDDELIALVRLAAARMGRTERRFDTANPRLDLRLPGGQRLHALMHLPIAVQGRWLARVIRGHMAYYAVQTTIGRSTRSDGKRPSCGTRTQGRSPVR